jgi:hypothetical protein
LLGGTLDPKKLGKHKSMKNLKLTKDSSDEEEEKKGHSPMLSARGGGLKLTLPTNRD